MGVSPGYRHQETPCHKDKGSQDHDDTPAPTHDQANPVVISVVMGECYLHPLAWASASLRRSR
jgi:hypothetical protein